MLKPENLPSKLCNIGQFCCWRYEERDGKRTKVPYNPRTGGRAQSTNPATFAPLIVALESAKQGKYDGIGVGIFGILGAIDIDHCINDNGELSEMALDIKNTMQAYTEYSPSGKGFRILFTVPPNFQYDKARYYINNRKAGLEVYIAGCTKKYVTVTGNTLTPGMDLEERGEQLAKILEKYMLRSAKDGKKPTQNPSITEILDDSELIERAKRSKRGREFSALMNGDTSAYDGDDSRADIALCNMLAFWTGRDAARIDRIFRTSGLMREKWDRPTSGSTYGAITIRNAINTIHQAYDPKAHFKAKTNKIILQNASSKIKLADLHPEKNARYGWNDIGNGNLFADWYKDVARYVPERKKWFVYDGSVWGPDTGSLYTMELCKKLADDLTIYALSIPDERQRNDYLDFVKRWQRRNYRETILKDAAGVYPVLLSDFDKDPYLYNCLNGTLNLKTGKFHPHSPSDMLATIAEVKYDPQARCELWEKVIFDAMQDDTDKALFLQKILGYGLTGDTSEECFFILYGATTRNGKGTIMETYMRMQGGYGRAARPETIAQKDKANSSAPTEDIARLSGARVVNISEPGKNMVLSAALVKTLTGNDKIIARFLNENSFEFYPQFKFFINTNYLPKVTDITVFSSGRVNVIPFERHFSEEEQDKDLKKKLAQPENLSGVLNWCLEGLRLFREKGLAPPASVIEATKQYQRDSDKISRFIDEMMEPDVYGEIRTEEAYNTYQEWCIRNGQRSESFPAFRQSIETHAEIKKKRPSGAGRNISPCWFILGLKLKCVPVCSSIS